MSHIAPSTKINETSLAVKPAKRVLYVITRGIWGGAQRFAFDLIEGARAAGFEPSLACGELGLLASRLTARGVPVFEIKELARDVSLLQDARACRELIALFKRERPDVVHLISSKAGLLGSIAARIAGVPCVVFSALGWAFNEPRGFAAKAVFAIGHYVTVLLAHKTLTVSCAVAQDIKRWPLLSKRVAVNHLGIDTPTLLPKEEARRALIARDPTLAEVQNQLWVGTIAELHRNKGIDVGVRVFEQAPCCQLQWVVLGRGEEAVALKAQTAGLNNIHLLGFIEDAAQYLLAFDLFFLPSRTESFGYVLLEAGQAGIPVVASNVGGIPEIINNGAGITVPSEDVTGFSEAIASLAQDPHARQNFSAALKEKVSQEFSLESMRNRTFSCYKERGQVLK